MGTGWGLVGAWWEWDRAEAKGGGGVRLWDRVVCLGERLEDGAAIAGDGEVVRSKWV